MSAVVLVVVLASGLGIWYWQTRTGEPEEKISTEGAFGAEVFERSQNPVSEALPQTNPFEKNINPLKDVYQNPFQ